VENLVYENKHMLLKEAIPLFFFHLRKDAVRMNVLLKLCCSLCMVSVVKCQIDSNIVTMS
jgi:hypothetical protein